MAFEISKFEIMSVWFSNYTTKDCTHPRYSISPHTYSEKDLSNLPVIIFLPSGSRAFLCQIAGSESLLVCYPEGPAVKLIDICDPVPSGEK